MRTQNAQPGSVGNVVARLRDRLLGTTTDAGTCTGAEPTLDTALPRPAVADVIDAIVRETGCSRTRARNMIGWVSYQVGRARFFDNESHPQTEEMAGRSYALFEAVIPHDAPFPQIGTAHDLLNRRLLRGHELNIVHTQLTSYGDEPRTFCAVLLQLDVI